MSARALRAGIANRRRAIGCHGTTGGERPSAAYACGTEEADGAKAVAAPWAAPCPDDNLSVQLAISHFDLVLRGAHCVGSCAGMNLAKTYWRCSLITRE